MVNPAVDYHKMYPYDPARANAMLDVAGVKRDATLAQSIYIKGDFHVCLFAYTSYSDPALDVARAFVSASLGKLYGNPTGYSNPTVNALFARGEAATALANRGVFHKQAILADDLPALTLRQYKEIDGASRKLHGIWGHAQGNGHWSTAWMEK